jgi:endonuclease-8
MPEGPSIVILKDAVQAFKGQKVISVSGNTKIDKDRMLNQKVIDFKTWGKHFLICFKYFTIRIHMLMFGSYSINEKKDRAPRLSLQFNNGELNFYTCSVKEIDEPIDEVYDFTGDVMNDGWDAKAARRKLKDMPGTLVCDALLDQHIFAGVGNIIKNEVLFRIKVHPATPVGKLPPRKLTELIKEARNYSFDFLEWKRAFVLKKHWLAHTKKTCPRDGSPIVKEYLGKTHRRTFFCNTCQVKY